MYLDISVPVPAEKGKITVKTINKTPYVYYEISRKYDSEKKYSKPKRVCIGKKSDKESDVMTPNTNFLRYFPEAVLPDETAEPVRSSCLHVGAFLAIRKIISDYSLDRMIAQIIGRDAGLFMDLAVYTIMTEGNAAQYYPSYAYNHPLMTEEMKVYSDSKISGFLGEDMDNQRIAFLNEWNRKRDHREKIYVSYDSTNKICQAGEVDLAEPGHSKEGSDKPVFNYSIAYDRDNKEPLFYEAYPGSIVDVSQLQLMLDKADGYGYKHIGFILDRGYFSKENIHFMDKKGYEFILMVKGMKKLVREVVTEVRGTFEQNRAASIRAFKVSGTTVRRQLYPSDTKERYFHVFYDERKHAAEREKLESEIDAMAKQLKSWQGMQVRPTGKFAKYFDLIFYHEGKADEAFTCARERTEVIDREIRLCGYFVIITSDKMTAGEALTLYKGRDSSEKLFRGDKSYLGNKAERVYSSESVDTKVFIEFVALIIRNRIYNCLKEEMQKQEKKFNFMTVPAALRELDKIEMIKGGDNEYRLDHAVSATQKKILNAFGMTVQDIKRKAAELSTELARIEIEAAEKNTPAGAAASQQ
ncbi:MAG: IS1634 family transposase [bacterium]